MKNNKGITLIIVIMTVVMLAIIGTLLITNGTKTYKESEVVQFDTYMKSIQKKVDIIVEENESYTAYGKALTQEQKARLQEIIDNDNQIATRDVNESKLRYLDSDEIKRELELFNIEDEIVINFANRDVISLKGVEKDGVMHYVEYTLH